MQFNSTVVVALLFMIAFVQNLHGQTCNCRICPDSVTLNANSEYQISNSALCPAGTAAAVSTIDVQSTDGSGFQIYTMDDPSDTVYYSAGSTATTVSCFNMGSGVTVGGQKSRIYVIIRCKSSIRSCSLRYSIRLICARVQTTSNPKSTSTFTVGPVSPTTVTTAKPVNPSTVTAIVVDNTCDCQCCRGSAVCVPVYVGSIFYGTNTCDPSNCAHQCSTLFSDCPADGSQTGKVETHCKGNAGITLKNPFYMSLLVLFIFKYLI